MNEKRWKPELGEKYWFVTSAGRPSTDVNNLGLADNRFNLGNCFETEAEAQAAAEKFKALFLSLHGDGENLQHDDLPKLTTEVFDHPACPGWAKWAAVDEYGTVWLTAEKPNVIMVASEANGWSTGGSSYTHLASVRFDASDWENSLIERPSKALPDWCKVGEWLYVPETNAYHKITFVDESQVNTVSYDTDCCSRWDHQGIMEDTKQAKLRPYNAAEMKKLVGKVIEVGLGQFSLCLRVKGRWADFLDDCDTDDDRARIISYNNDMLKCAKYIDGPPCGVVEHLENGEWVK